MTRFITRVLVATAVASTWAQAGPPSHYRLALIQVAYKDRPARYTLDQLQSAANEITDYYARISYLKFYLQITVNSIVYTPPACPACIFPLPPVPFVLAPDRSGVAIPDPSNQFVVQRVAELAQAAGHIDFSAIDGIAILSSISSAGDYMPGTVAVPASSPVAGTYETSQLFENPIDPRLSPTGPSGIFWSPWAPLIGKMIETRSGTVFGPYFDGYPAGEADGYSLMDSCHPCAAGAYSVIGTRFMTGAKQVFNGWLPDGQVILETDDFTSHTFTLSPLASLLELVDPTVCPFCSKVIKVPITPGDYYLVEARTRTISGGIATPDALPTEFWRGGLWDEGIHITRVRESADPPVLAINSCDSLPGGCEVSPSDPRYASCNSSNPVGFTVDMLPPYCWPYPLFHVRDMFNGVRRTARVEGGATWGDVDRETQAFGLATTGGVARPTGVAGLTLGGGHGFLMRKYGLACDNLISAQVVTADGELLTASADDHSDLFWGLRGGGGNFGIVTSLEFQLHAVDQVLGGLLVYPIERARDVFGSYRDLTASAPDELGSLAVLGRLSDGTPVAVIMICYCGEPATGERLLKPLRNCAPMVADQVAPMPYIALQSIVENFNPNGLRNYWKSGFLTGIPDEAIQTLVDHFACVPTPFTHIVIEHLGGAVERVLQESAAVAHRDAPYNMLIVGMWQRESEDEPGTAWVRKLWDGMQPFSSGGVYVNYVGTEGDERTSRGHTYTPAIYAQLQTIKRKFDPGNVFHLNHNIDPA